MPGGMEQEALHLIESGRPFLEAYGLWAVFFGLVTETFMFTGVFVPGFGILFAAGFLIGSGSLPVWPVLGAAWAGSVLGDQLSYMTGYCLGHRLLRKRWQLADQVRSSLADAAPMLLLAYHYSPLFRPVVPCTAGTVRLRPRVWIVFDSIGVMLWVVAMLVLGYTSHGVLAQSSGIFVKATNGLLTVAMLWITWRVRSSVLAARSVSKEQDADAECPRQSISPM